MVIEIIKAVKIATSEVFDPELQLDEYETAGEVVMSVVIPQATISMKGEYYFNTLQLLHDQLLHFGIGLKCYGSLINACQSLMASYSQKFYITAIGKQAMKKDFVDMFEYTDIDMFPTSDEQKNFHQKWLSSLAT